ncbi:MAG: Gfo/Idh/MocA family oxidoreductase [Candidatus Omnitrophica bacterium]|nr:Gfo/Idh/MocA family oxidoreductase [Candidatus Omnitrophota bacterium]
MKGKVYSIGMIGCGVHARTRLLPALKYCRKARIAALADPARDLSAERAVWGGPKTYSDHRAMLDDRSISLDAVIVATPPDSHREIATFCMGKGKHVLLEKPVALTLRDARALVEARDRTGVKVMVGHQRRFSPMDNSVRDLYGKGLIGKTVAINAVHEFSSDSRGAATGYLKKRELSGGVIMEYACHDIDFFRYLLGAEAVEVYARVSSTHADDDTAALVVTFSNGVIANLTLSSCTVDEEHLEIFGTEGIIRSDRYRTVKAEIDLIKGLKDRKMRALKTFARGFKSLMLLKYAFKRNILAAYISEIGHFIDSIEEGKDPVPGLEDGIKAMEAADAAIRSGISGKPVRVCGPEECKGGAND